MILEPSHKNSTIGIFDFYMTSTISLYIINF